MDRWEPTPVPLGDDPSKHDIGDDVRTAIVHRLIDDFALGHAEVPVETRRQMAMLAAASVRALMAELSVLRTMGAPSDPPSLTETERRP